MNRALTTSSDNILHENEVEVRCELQCSISDVMEDDLCDVMSKTLRFGFQGILDISDCGTPFGKE